MCNVWFKKIWITSIIFKEYMMKTLYDVQQLLKQFGIIVYVGKRIYDIELMTLEVKNI